MPLEDVTFKNQSGSKLIMIFPDGRQEDFPDGKARSYFDFGKYYVKDACDPVYSFTYQTKKYIASVNLTDKSHGGNVTIRNYSGFEITVTLPSDQPEENIQNGSARVYWYPGTYTVTRKDEPYFTFNYHRGTISLDLGGLAPP